MSAAYAGAHRLVSGGAGTAADRDDNDAEFLDVKINPAYYFRFSGGHKGMIEIILTVCAVANPTNCEEKYLQFVFDGSINQCMMGAQPYIAEWIGKHPQWVATKWSCDYPGHEKRRI
jgi:hypothetical protein